jgi:hypothetical protein
VFDLGSGVARPGGQRGWTSADAAGLPTFPGHARCEDAALGPGGIRHALRSKVAGSRRAYVPPATHWASSRGDPNLPPTGMRLRLWPSILIASSFSTEARALLNAMKLCGMIIADNGRNCCVSGAPDEHWGHDALHALGQAQGRNFEVVRVGGLAAG